MLKRRVVGMILLSFVFGVFSAWASGKEAYDRAMALERAGEIDGAIIAMHIALAEEPLNDFYLATAAHLEFNGGRHEDAFQHAASAIEINPVAWYNVVAARAAFAMGKFEESRAYAQAACRFGKDVLGEANYTTADEILHQDDVYRIQLTWPIPVERVGRQGDGYGVTVAAPLADLPYQKTSIRVNNAQIIRDYIRNGNRLLDLAAASPDSIELVTEITRFPLDQSAVLQSSQNDIPDHLQIYLTASHKVNVDSPALQAIAAEQKASMVQETVRNILSWMNDNLRYVISEFSNAGEVVERGYGECWAWSSVFTALCRLNGIPARNVWGAVNTPGFAPAGYLKGHTWAEFYAGGEWIQVEPQYPGLLGTLPSHYLRVAHSTEEGWGAVMNLPDTMHVIERQR